MANSGALTLEAFDNAPLLALSGLRNPWPGMIGVAEVNARADLLLVDGNPLVNLELIADPERRFAVVMKDGLIFKNTAQ